MPESVYRESRTYRERDDPPSDDDRYSRSSTVRRYKVQPNRRDPHSDHVDRVERTERVVETNDFIEDDRRSRFSSNTHHLHHPGRSSGDFVEVDTSRRVERNYLPDRPRSAFDPPQQRNTTVVEKVIERERSPMPDFFDVTRRSTHDDGRSLIYEKEREVERHDPYGFPDRTRTTTEKRIVERDDDRWHDDRDRSRTVEKRVVEREEDHFWDERERPRDRELVYEKTKEVERDRGPTSPRDWERHSHSPWERDNVDVRVETRVERRDDGTEVTVQRRVEERRDETPFGEVERYRKETEYWEPAPDPAPVIIRQRAPEQRIIVQEAPEPPPIIVPYRQPPPPVIARREEPREDEYYRRREDRDRFSDGYRSDDDDVYIRRTIIRRERSRSPEHNSRLRLAEGAAAGAGLAALAASRRSGDGDHTSHRGRKVLAGAALGALGTEVFKRARSAYNDRYADDDDLYYDYHKRGRSRSRGRDDRDDNGDRHSKIKTGLGLAAAALAVAGAAKYYQSQKIDKEEARRGRSRNRHASDSESSYYSRSHSRGERSRSRGSGIAKAAAGTAAVAGLVHHLRSKSKGRNGSKSRSRSQSRLRTGAEIVAAGLAGAAGKKIYDRQKAKKEGREKELSDEEFERDMRERERSRSRRDRSRSVISESRSRSRSRFG